MSAKNRDRQGRWRTKTVAFHVSEEENMAIDEAVALTGMTKQDYIIAKLTNRDVVVVGNPRVFKALKTKMEGIYNELLRINSAGDVNEQLLDSINLVAKIYAGMIENGKGDEV